MANWLDDTTDAAWNALQAQDPDTPDTPSQFYETDYEDIYADDNGNFYQAQEDDDGDAYLLPVELTDASDDSASADEDDGEPDLSDVEEDLLDTFLKARGYDDPEHAPEDAIHGAVADLDEFTARFKQATDGNPPDDLEAALDAEQIVADWLDENGFTAEEAAPYIRHGLAAAQDGKLPDIEAVFDVAKDGLDRWKGHQRDAIDTDHYASLGFDKGMDTALDDMLAPKAPYKATRSHAGSNQVLGDEFDDALGEVIEARSSKRHLKELARKQVREAR